MPPLIAHCRPNWRAPPGRSEGCRFRRQAEPLICWAGFRKRTNSTSGGSTYGASHNAAEHSVRSGAQLGRGDPRAVRLDFEALEQRHLAAVQMFAEVWNDSEIARRLAVERRPGEPLFHQPSGSCVLAGGRKAGGTAGVGARVEDQFEFQERGWNAEAAAAYLGCASHSAHKQQEGRSAPALFSLK
jgi:hypothetical protein